MRVPSVDEYPARVEKLDGKVVMPKTAVPGMVYFVICLDSENNNKCLWHLVDGSECAIAPYLAEIKRMANSVEVFHVLKAIICNF